jgi:hypothetical protein
MNDISEMSKEYLKGKYASGNIVKYKRVNNPNSWFELVKETDEEYFSYAGVYLKETIEKGEGKKPQIKSTKICSVLYIENKIRAESKNWYRLVVQDGDTVKYRDLQAKEILMANLKNNDGYEWLYNNGLIVYGKNAPYVAEYLQTAESKAEVIIGTEQTGWHEYFDEDGLLQAHYVQRGYSTSEKIYCGSSQISYKKAGSEKEQLEFIADLFYNNPVVFFVASYAIAGMISRFILKGEMNPILAIIGNSAKGKTTLIQVIYSLITNPNLFSSMNQTAYNMSLKVQDNNDSFLAFDEMGESKLKPEEKMQLIYSLSNGKPRQQTKKKGDIFVSGEDKPAARFSLIVAGEKSLIEGFVATEGVSVRLNELVLSNGYVLWDSFNLGDSEEEKQRANAEAESVTRFINTHFGHIGPLVLSEIEKDIPILEDKFVEILATVRKNIGATTSILNRKAKVLAYAMIGGEYLAKVLWQPEIQKDVLLTMFEAGKIGLFNNIEDFNEQKDHIRDKLASFESTFAHYFNVKNLEGSLSINNDGTEFLNKNKVLYGEVILADTYKDIWVIGTQMDNVCTLLEVDRKLFISYLDENKILVKDNQGKTQVNKKIKGNVVKHYRIRIPYSFFTLDERAKVVAEDDSKQGEIDPDMPANFLGN